MLEGRVKTWDDLRGWGFIEDRDGFDYFVSIQDVRKGQSLQVGDKVKYDVFQSQRGPSAEHVTKVT